MFWSYACIKQLDSLSNLRIEGNKLYRRILHLMKVWSLWKFVLLSLQIKFYIIYSCFDFMHVYNNLYYPSNLTIEGNKLYRSILQKGEFLFESIINTIWNTIISVHSDIVNGCCTEYSIFINRYTFLCKHPMLSYFKRNKQTGQALIPHLFSYKNEFSSL